jgi:hypothetical protein
MRPWVVAIAAVAVFGGFSSVPVCAGEAAPIKAKAKPYPLKVCAVSGEKLAAPKGKQLALNHQGQEIKLCSAQCVQDFNASPDQYLKKLSQSRTPAQSPNTHAGWTLDKNPLFAVGDAPSRWDWNSSNW